MICDLHTHTTASDGSLAPAELVSLARESGVDMLAVTDHDTVAGCAAAVDAGGGGPSIVAGIEFSTTWCGRGIHVVGLNVDPGNAELLHGIEQQQRAREARAREIGRRLTRLGIEDPYPAVKRAAGDAALGRPHFARHLVDIGVVSNVAAAFRKHLGSGKAGDVRHGWASLGQVVAWIHSAGGSAVLAHPAKYRMTLTRLRALAADFVASGGDGIEVVCGQQATTTTRKMAGIARDFELAASIGSDFHHPGQSWSRPGCSGQLPTDLRPVWQAW